MRVQAQAPKLLRYHYARPVDGERLGYRQAVGAAIKGFASKSPSLGVPSSNWSTNSVFMIPPAGEQLEPVSYRRGYGRTLPGSWRWSIGGSSPLRFSFAAAKFYILDDSLSSITALVRMLKRYRFKALASTTASATLANSMSGHAVRDQRLLSSGASQVSSGHHSGPSLPTGGPSVLRPLFTIRVISLCRRETTSGSRLARSSVSARSA